jgi:hypothetical protein
MSDIHTMYEELTRFIDSRMPSLVASLVPTQVIPRAEEGTQERPLEVVTKGHGTVTNVSQSSVSGGECG